MKTIEKLYSLLIFLAVLIGISIGQFEMIANHAEMFIMPLLIAMLYITFLQIPINVVKKAFKNVRFTFLSIVINFVWTPIFAWILALLFLNEYPALYIVFLMLMVTPCTDWYLIFTGLTKGNTALATAILPINLLLQVILLPVYLFLFGGTTGIIEWRFLQKVYLSF